jgi:hypothetical protein
MELHGVSVHLLCSLHHRWGSSLVQLYLRLKCRPAAEAYRWEAIKSNERHDAESSTDD